MIKLLRDCTASTCQRGYTGDGIVCVSEDNERIAERSVKKAEEFTQPEVTRRVPAKDVRFPFLDFRNDQSLFDNSQHPRFQDGKHMVNFEEMSDDFFVKSLFDNEQALYIIFYSHDCPYSQEYIERLMEIVRSLPRDDPILKHVRFGGVDCQFIYETEGKNYQKACQAFAKNIRNNGRPRFVIPTTRLVPAYTRKQSTESLQELLRDICPLQLKVGREKVFKVCNTLEYYDLTRAKLVWLLNLRLGLNIV